MIIFGERIMAMNVTNITKVLTSMALGCAFALPLVTGSSWAQTVYKWQDEEGLIHYGHFVPPDQVKAEHQRLNNQAVVVEHIEDADIPLMVREARLSQNQLASRVKKRLLLATYDNEAEIELERDRAVEFLDMETNIISSQVHSLRNNLKDAEDMFQQVSDDQGLAYTTLQDTISSLRQSLRRQYDRQRELHSQRLLVQQQFVRELQSYRDAVNASDQHMLELSQGQR